MSDPVGMPDPPPWGKPLTGALIYYMALSHKDWKLPDC